MVTLGSVVFALSVSLFMDPYDIVPGGVTGIAMLLHTKLDVIPLGTMALLLNVPLLLLAWFFLGHRFLLYTIYGTVVSSVLIDLTARWLPPVQTETILAGVAGGVLMGIGLGLVFSRGATTGGSDIIARLLKLVFPHINIGRLMLAFDGLIVLASMAVFGNINVGLYSGIALFISSRGMDALLYGLNIERMAYVISDKCDEIVREIDAQLGRGATLLHAEGAYRRQSSHVILCAFKRQQIAQLKHLVKVIDPDAFLIVAEAHEVLGEGFKDYEKNAL